MEQTSLAIEEISMALYFKNIAINILFFNSYSSLERITVTLNFSSQIPFFERSMRKLHTWVWLTQEPIKMQEGDSAAAI